MDWFISTEIYLEGKGCGPLTCFWPYQQPRASVRAFCCLESCKSPPQMPCYSHPASANFCISYCIRINQIFHRKITDVIAVQGWVCRSRLLAACLLLPLCKGKYNRDSSKLLPVLITVRIIVINISAPAFHFIVVHNLLSNINIKQHQTKQMLQVSYYI